MEHLPWAQWLGALSAPMALLLVAGAWLIRDQRRQLEEARKELKDMSERMANAMLENAKSNFALADAVRRGGP